METATRDSALGRRRWPRSRPRRSASAKALARVLAYHAPLDLVLSEDHNHQPRPGQIPEPPKLDDDVPDFT